MTEKERLTINAHTIYTAKMMLYNRKESLRLSLLQLHMSNPVPRRYIPKLIIPEAMELSITLRNNIKRIISAIILEEILNGKF